MNASILESIDQKVKELRSKIEPLSKELSSLVKRKKQLLSEITRKKKRLKLDSDLELCKKQLHLAYQGLSANQVAEKLGCTKHNFSSRVEWAWRNFYPNHYENCHWLRSFVGPIRALRMSKEPFICQLSDEPYVPESFIDDYEWQKSLRQWIPLSKIMPTENDGDVQFSMNGIEVYCCGNLEFAKNYASSRGCKFWRKRIEDRMPLYWMSR